MSIANVVLKLDYLQAIIDRSENEEMMQNILDKGDAFYEMEKVFPKEAMKNQTSSIGYGLI